jgi:hypothetical protein
MSVPDVFKRQTQTLDIQSSKRTTKIIKIHRQYRNSYLREIKGQINETDYLIAFAVDSAARPYLVLTGTHAIDRRICDVTVAEADYREFPRIRRRVRAGNRLRLRRKRMVRVPPKSFEREEEGPIPILPEESRSWISEEEEEEEKRVAIVVGELGYEVDACDLAQSFSVSGVELVPKNYFEALRSRGVSRLFLTNFPENGNLEAVQARGSSVGVVVSIGIPDTYSKDPEFARLLEESSPGEFMRYLGSIAHEQLLHTIHLPGECSSEALSTALLLLPGLKIVRDETTMASAVLGLLAHEAVRSGTFSIPEIRPIAGEIVAWKYSGQTTRILVCANALDQQCEAAILCADVGAAHVEVFEWLMDSRSGRQVHELRSQELHVVLPLGTIQIFEY